MNSTDASDAADLDGDTRGPLRIIAGPTGAGKSALALRLAEHHGAMIISADSRQIYRGFDIGTAKPDADERARVRHEGIDVAEPTERWSAARWAADATEWESAARRRGQPVLVVGGSGLWLHALVHPLWREPAVDPDRRREVERTLADLETPRLRRWVEALDPPRAALGRTQLLRSAQVALLTGKRLSDWHEEQSARPRREARWLVLDPGPALQAVLSDRLEAMLAAGWRQETESLIPDVPADAPAWNACGYQEVRDVVEGRRTIDAARERVLVRTRQFAKRQRTWFRNQLDDEPAVLRLDPRAADAAERAERWFLGGGDA